MMTRRKETRKNSDLRVFAGNKHVNKEQDHKTEIDLQKIKG